MRQEILDLIKLGPMPSECAEEDEINEYDAAVARINGPVSSEEALALIDLFGPDECYGLAWDMVRMVEGSLGWPNRKALEKKNGYWVDILKKRISNRYGWEW